MKYITMTDNFNKGYASIDVGLAVLQQYFSTTLLISKSQMVYNLLKPKSKLQYFVKVKMPVLLKTNLSTEVTERGSQRSGNNSTCAHQSWLSNEIQTPTQFY